MFNSTIFVRNRKEIENTLFIEDGLDSSDLQ